MPEQQQTLSGIPLYSGSGFHRLLLRRNAVIYRRQFGQSLMITLHIFSLSDSPAFFAAALIAVEEAVDECRKSCADKRSGYEQPNLLNRYRISAEQAHKCRAEAAGRVHRRARIGDAHEVNKGQRQANNK